MCQHLGVSVISKKTSENIWWKKNKEISLKNQIKTSIFLWLRMTQMTLGWDLLLTCEDIKLWSLFKNRICSPKMKMVDSS